jgi:DNA-binding NarL/FixJ family response regulator
MVGRREPFERVRALLADLTSGGVLVAGPAGVGKTRLAVECLQAAAAAGYPTARVSGTRSASGLPFGALAPLLPGDEGVARAQFDRAELLRRAATAIIRRGQGQDRRLVLMVDDAHLLDEVSAILVHQLAESRAVFVLATVRSGEAAPDPVVSMWKDGAAPRIDIAPLSLAEVEALLSTALGGSVDGPSLRFLAHRSEGNPLFLRELVLAAQDAGALSEVDGVMFLTGPLPPSNRLIELVESRIQGLPDDEREALDLLAFAEDLGASILSWLTYPVSLEGLERKGLITVVRDRRRVDARLAHPLHGDVLRHRTGVLRAQSIKKALADALASTGARRREDLLRLATWRLEAGDYDADLMLRAAAQARARCDYGLAERLLSAGIEVGGGGEAALLSGQLLYLQGRHHEAEARLAPLSALASDDAARGRVAATRVDNLWYGLGRRDQAVQAAAEAEQAIADPEVRNILTARRAGVLRGASDTRAALALIEPLLARTSGPALAWACQIGAVAFVQAGHLDRAIAVADRGLVVHRALPADALLWRPSIHEWARSYALTEAGRLNEAEDQLRAGYERALREGSIAAEPYLLWQLSITLRAQGLAETSVRWAREAVSLLRRAGWPGYLLRFSMAELAHGLALLGRGSEAMEVIAEIDALPAEATETIFPLSIIGARAWTAVAAGDVGRAVTILREAASRHAASGSLAVEMAVSHDLARLGRAAEVVDRVTELTKEVEGPLALVRADHVRALAAGDSDGLDRASLAFEALGALLLAAEAAAMAAAVQRRERGTRAAAPAERRAAMLTARCEGATTPALAAAAPAVLSPREREIAALAGGGLANREIAERLYLSVRTVENQLQRAYEKLGVSNRAELRDALGSPDH